MKALRIFFFKENDEAHVAERYKIQAVWSSSLVSLNQNILPTPLPLTVISLYYIRFSYMYLTHKNNVAPSQCGTFQSKVRLTTCTLHLLTLSFIKQVTWSGEMA